MLHHLARQRTMRLVWLDHHYNPRETGHTPVPGGTGNGSDMRELLPTMPGERFKCYMV